MHDTLLSHADFEPHLHSGFTLATGSGATGASGGLVLTLAEIEIGRHRAASAEGRAPFSLLFATIGADVLAQGTYRLSHPAMGELDIFMGPMSREDTTTRYSATFN